MVAAGLSSTVSNSPTTSPAAPRLPAGERLLYADALTVGYDGIPILPPLTLTVGAGSSANTGDEPATTRPEAAMTEKTKRRIRSVSHAASRAGVTRGSTQVRASGPPG